MFKEGFAFMFISSFMALFPVANPVGAGFIVNGFLSGLDLPSRKSVIRRILIDYLFVGLGSLAIGHFVLLLFDLSLPIIQLGGGLLICRTALSWLGDSDSAVGRPPARKGSEPIDLRAVESQVFYPITFPISIGPGSVSVILTLMASASKGDWVKSAVNYLVIAFVIVLMCLILYLFLSQGHRIMKKLGSNGTTIINKMVAFFTFCVGIQIVVAGVAKLFDLHTM